MIPKATLLEYLQFIEFRVLEALNARVIVRKGDITVTLTKAVTELGKCLGFKVRTEVLYSGFREDPAGHRCDILWEGNDTILWEIDRTFKPRTVEKLATIPTVQRIWIVWAEESDKRKPALEIIGNANMILISEDVRKLIWDRIRAEKELNRELQHVRCQNHRFHAARKISDHIQSGK